MSDKSSLSLTNCVSSSELETLLKMQLSAIAADPSVSHILPPLMVWGAPGLGKSSIIKAAAAKAGIDFIDVRLAQREPVDIRGLPVPTADGVKWLVSSDWPRNPASKGIILFDEITAADRSLQVAAYEFILDRRLGSLYTVPDGWYICAAGNRASDHAASTTMSSALANRFMHVEIEANAEDWRDWAQVNNINPSVIGFINYRPGMLFNQDEEELERGWPSPRSWERVSKMLDVCASSGQPESFTKKLVYGLVGKRAGVEFMAFHKLNQAFADVGAAMRNPSRKFEVPHEADKCYALCAAMAYLVWRGHDEKDEAALLDGFFRISMKLPADFATLAMISTMLGNGEKDRHYACNALYHHPSYKAWSENFGNALRKGMAA